VSFMTNDNGKIVGFNNNSLTGWAKICVANIKWQTHVSEKDIEIASSPRLQMELLWKWFSVIQDSSSQNNMGKLTIEN